MNDSPLLWLEKAKESMDAAKELAELGYPGISITRSYYGMFYSAQALLLTENLAFSKHSAVISAFGKHFVKTGKIPVEYHLYLREAKEERLLGDYDLATKFSKEEAIEQVIRSEGFYKMALAFLTEQGFH